MSKREFILDAVDRLSDQDQDRVLAFVHALSERSEAVSGQLSHSKFTTASEEEELIRSCHAANASTDVQEIELSFDSFADEADQVRERW